MTNRNINDSKVEQTVNSPPPTAVAPTMMSGGGNDLCTTGVSGAVQTQILGISGGSTVRDLNCERLKNAKTLYDMGMKVAAVATMCQDRRIFDAMWHAGTPCPFEGMIGAAAKRAWEAHPNRIPKHEVKKEDDSYQKILIGVGIAAVLGVAF
jgi:ABC-type lipoprotein release transport system permease subunit